MYFRANSAIKDAVPGARDRESGELIERLRRENGRLREELARAEADRARVERERTRLEREHARLKDELEAARRAGTRQAAPFSKRTPTRRPRRPGRKPSAYPLRARTADRSGGVGRRRALAGNVSTATVLPVMSKNSTE